MALKLRKRRMIARDPTESHRVSTPLELLFDLCFVVAIAQAAAKLHHGVAAGQAMAALGGYIIVFFAIWWAWMNFTWFASAYDTDDSIYRLKALVQMLGVLILAAGVPRAFDAHDLRVMTIGYVVMRVGLVAQWIRAAVTDTERRPTAIRYAVGVTVCQIGWVSLLFLPSLTLAGFIAIGLCELGVPVWAERAGATRWHPHHVAERYGLLTLIVLGEAILSTTVGIQSALDECKDVPKLASVIVGAVLIVFSMWWIYFNRPPHHLSKTGWGAFIWGYGHYGIFSSAAAVGAGLGVAVDEVSGHVHIGASSVGLAATIPVAIFLLLVWAVHLGPIRGGPVARIACPVGAVAIVASSVTPWPVLLAGVFFMVVVGLVGHVGH